MTWTTAQQAAIDSRGQTLLLSAAAGSGKTAVLVERIIRRLLDSTVPLDITNLLVVTFTKVAAAEMRSRIGEALCRVLEGEENLQAERQLALLPSANISTMHAFCQSVIHQYFYTIDLDPKFKIGGQDELDLLRQDVLEKLFLSYYETNSDFSPQFYRLIEMFASDRDDTGLMAIVERFYDFARSNPWPKQWLDEVQKAYCIPKTATMDTLFWGTMVKEEIHFALQEQGEIYDSLVSRLTMEEGPADYIDLFKAEQEMIKAACGASNWEDLYKAIRAISFGRLPSKRAVSEIEKEQREIFRAARDIAKKTIKELQNKYFTVTGEEWLAGLRDLYPLVQGLVKIIGDFADAYQRAKQEKGCIDFSDLEHFCLRILLAPTATSDAIEPSVAALELRAKFKEVLVDEYQDTNGVQELITSLVSEPDNRFMVGDVKQSVYRFRLADPTLFMNKYKAFSEEKTALRRRIDLSKNFRSDATILEAVNFVFGQIMTMKTAEMDYGDREKLYPGRVKPENRPDNWVGGAVEVHILDRKVGTSGEIDSEEQRELSAFEEEAQIITARLVDLKKAGLTVERKDGTAEALTWRHMVVLLRSPKSRLDSLLTAFRAAGVPAYAEQRGGYFAAVEVEVMWSLLQCIDNPEQDLAMAAVLRSPIVGLSAERLGALRLSGTDTLWQLLPAYTELLDKNEEREKLEAFATHMEKWRTYARRHSVASLLRLLYEDTGYMEYASGMPGGAVRQANLQALYDRARAYETTDFRGLFRFLRFLEKMRNDGMDLAPGQVLSEGADVVRIMSIHKSKGLEFPVVVVANLGKSFSQQDQRSMALFHKKWGIGLKQHDPEWNLIYPSLAWHAIRHQLAMENKAEEERVLYVAMTRAKDKLILTGHSADLVADRERWRYRTDNHERMSDSQIINSRSYLDLIMNALAYHQDTIAWANLGSGGERKYVVGGWEITAYGGQSVAVETPGRRDERLLAVEKGQQTGTTIPEWLPKQLQWQYPYAGAIIMAAKLSVTEVKRMAQSQLQQDADQELSTHLIEPSKLDRRDGIMKDDAFAQQPNFLQPADVENRTGADRGTALHRIMQYIDLQGDLSRAGLRQQLIELVAGGMLRDEELPQQAMQKIEAFFESSVGRRLVAADRNWRELPFGLLVPASQFTEKTADSDEIFIQGVIDCLFAEPDGLVLVDYKSDRLTDEKQFLKRYAVQLQLYRQAAERIMALPIKEIYIYSFNLGRTIRLDES